MSARQTVGLILCLLSIALLLIWAGWKTTLAVYFLVFANTLMLMPGKKPPPGVF